MKGTIGEIRRFAGSYEIQDWELCDGQVMKIDEFTALYSVIGTNYGGDGRKTFLLPDLNNNIDKLSPKFIICAQGLYPVKKATP